MEPAAEGRAPGMFDRPNQVFLIDGGRGAGKTFALLTVQHAIDVIAAYRHGKPLSDDIKDWLKLCPPKSYDEKIFTAHPLRPVTLRIIFPGEFTEGEMLMEHVFAAIVEHFGDALERLGDKEPAKRKKLEDLRKELSTDVARGWYFARRFGLDAVVRDSLDYEDLVRKWGTESAIAADRITRWRRYVSKWLKAEGRNLLIILLDDSDNDEGLTESILHSIRLVLDHPQIVIVLAGNMGSMRESLIHRRMAGLAPSIAALRAERTPAGTEWRRRLRREVEEYLEKVIPQPQRAFVNPPRGRHSQERSRAATAVADGGEAGKGESDDFSRILGLTFEQLIRFATSNRTREAFLWTKFWLALKHEAKRVDAATIDERNDLERFLSWWFLGNFYANELQPTSARNLRAIRDYYNTTPRKDDPAGAAATHFRWRKKLPIALFNMSANFQLIQRLGDEDRSFTEWLRFQSLRSEWVRRRIFVINERELPEQSYSNAYVRYRLDMGLGLPFRDNADEVVPPELLPHAIGRRHLRRFFQPRQTPRRHRRLGLARWLDHAAIPSNCLYFNDLLALPDSAFIDVVRLPESARDAHVDALQTGQWEDRLADEWLSSLEDDQETEADEHLARYVREVVCEAIRGTKAISSGTLLNEMDPPDIFYKQSRAIYERFLEDELGSFDMSLGERAELFRWSMQGGRLRPRSAAAKLPPPRTEPVEGEGEAAGARTAERILDQWGVRNPERMIALYISLISDLRRAWHAIRIHQAAPGVMGGLQPGVTERDEAAALGSKDRLRLYTRATIEDELRKDGWTRRVLDVIGKDVLVREIANAFGDLMPEERDIDANLRQLKGSFTPGNVEGVSVATRDTLLSMSANEEYRLLFKNYDQDGDHDGQLEMLAAAVETYIAGPLKNNADDRRRLAIAQARFDLFLRDIDITRLFEATEGVGNSEQIGEEEASYRKWTLTLRSVARTLSLEWPFHENLISSEPMDIERSLFRDRAPARADGERKAAPRGSLLKVFEDEPRQAGGKDDSAREGSDAEKEDARSARNFVLLLYGIAPSLPAVIHANIMSRVYEAKLRLHSVGEALADKERDLTRWDDATLDRTILRSLQLIRGAIAEIDEWAGLVGQLAVILRCVKIKTLHLDLNLLVEAVSRRWDPRPDDAGPPLTEAQKIARYEEAKGNFGAAVMRDPFAAQVYAPFREVRSETTGKYLDEALLDYLVKLMSGYNSDSYRPLRDLAIFPDISTSTLFGEGWIGDIMSRGRVQQKMVADGYFKQASSARRAMANDSPADNSLSVSGIFGETEQWLWAANRSLRKLRDSIALDVVTSLAPAQEDETAIALEDETATALEDEPAIALEKWIRARDEADAAMALQNWIESRRGGADRGNDAAPAEAALPALVAEIRRRPRTESSARSGDG